MVIIAGTVCWFVFGKSDSLYKTKYERESVQVRFDMEIFDKIIENYWQKVEEKDLVELFRLSLTKAASTTELTLKSKDRNGIAKLLWEVIDKASETSRKDLALNTGVIALANLAPQGRNGLLSDKEETAFRDNVNNINRDKNLYNTLGLPEGADVESVEKAYVASVDKLKDDTSPEAEAKREELAQARDILGNENSKVIYDETKSEPTLSNQTLSSGALYLDLTKISNTTLQEVANRLAEFEDKKPPAGLILDLRGNAGGALDFARYFFSMFIGPNQYVYDYFHQGELKPERTPAFNKLELLSDVKNIAVLTDENTQSTSELLASIFKRFRLAKTVGVQTKGWGTVENTFPLKTDLGDGNKYSLLLVHSLTLREDGEPIEGRGVEPDINLKNTNWRQQLSNTFPSSAFVDDLVKVLSK